MTKSHLLQQSVQFDRLLLDISSNLVGLTIQELGMKIRKQLKLISDFFGVDRVCLFSFSDDGRTLSMIGDYSAIEMDAEKTRTDFSQIPIHYDKISSGEPVYFHDLPTDLTQHLGKENKPFATTEPLHAASLPVIHNCKTYGALTLDSSHSRQALPDSTLNQAKRLADIFASILMTAKEIEKSREIFNFQKILSEISFELTRLEIKDIDSYIEKGLERIGRFLNADRTAFLPISVSGHMYQWFNDGMDPTPEYGKIEESWPYVFLKMVKGKSINFADIEDMPPEAEKDKMHLRYIETKSFLNVPISLEGPIVGCFSVATAREYRTFQNEIIPRLRLVGEIFANALIRKTKAIELKKAFDNNNELLRFERVLSETSSHFANLPSEDIDEYIDFGLERIGEFLNADRCDYIYFDNADDFVKGRIYSWSKNGIKQVPDLNQFHRSCPWTKAQILKGKTVHFTRISELPDVAQKDKETWKRIGINSHANVPISIGGPIVGAISVSAEKVHQSWPEGIIPRLRLVGEVFSNALIRKRREREVLKAFDEIKTLKSKIEADFTYLQEEIEENYNHYNMIGNCPVFKSLILKIRQIAHTDTNVLILGETGTGKEMVARAIHANSRFKNRPMVRVNCAVLSPHLIDSELFGHEKGSFTGAHKQRIGRFELADGGILFLDEIGELPLESQAKLLRVIQEGEFERIGSSKTIKINVRLLVATNRNLQEEVKKGRFRKDLWYRLNVFPIEVPTLGKRKEDLPLLIDHFVKKHGKKLGKSIQKVPHKAIKIFENYEWQGNIRELENAVERAVIQSQGKSLQIPSFLLNIKTEPSKTHQRYSLDEIQRNYIIQTLEETKWRVSGPKGAAFILGLNPSTLKSRMRKLRIYR